MSGRLDVQRDGLAGERLDEDLHARAGGGVDLLYLQGREKKGGLNFNGKKYLSQFLLTINLKFKI